MPTLAPLQTRGSSGSSPRPLSSMAEGELGLSQASRRPLPPSVPRRAAGSKNVPCSQPPSRLHPTHQGWGARACGAETRVSTVPLCARAPRADFRAGAQEARRVPRRLADGFSETGDSLSAPGSGRAPLPPWIVPCRARRVSPWPRNALAKAVLSTTEGFCSGHPTGRGEVTWVPRTVALQVTAVSRPRSFHL